MNIPPKPPTPQEVYKSGILYYTIVDYHFIAPGSPILKAGWAPVKQMNYNHPIMLEKLHKLKKQSEQCLKNKEVDWDKLSRIFITI